MNDVIARPKPTPPRRPVPPPQPRSTLNAALRCRNGGGAWVWYLTDADGAEYHGWAERHTEALTALRDQLVDLLDLDRRYLVQTDSVPLTEALNYLLLDSGLGEFFLACARPGIEDRQLVHDRAVQLYPALNLREPVVISTDGSFARHGSRGGAAWIEQGAKRAAVVEFGGCASALHAELVAIRMAVQTVPRKRDVLIRTDSQSAIQLLRNGISSYGGKLRPAEVHEYHEIVAAIAARKGAVELSWVKGHAGDAHNDAVDRLARHARRHGQGIDSGVATAILQDVRTPAQ